MMVNVKIIVVVGGRKQQCQDEVEKRILVLLTILYFDEFGVLSVSIKYSIIINLKKTISEALQ